MSLLNQPPLLCIFFSLSNGKYYCHLLVFSLFIENIQSLNEFESSQFLFDTR